jgi:hypothetical protein
MGTNSGLADPDESGTVPTERRSILLRGYVETELPPARKPDWWTQPPSRFVLFFDTETTDDAAQRLRFGCYQLLEQGLPRQRGIFYDPDALKPGELSELRRVAALRHQRLMTASEFIDRVFYPVANAGGTIVGFNLPFDISRIAIAHDTARVVPRKNGSVDRSMQGGFTFKLSDEPGHGRVVVKHLSRRAASIHFAKPSQERGFFLDLKTLSAALTAKSHTLASLAESLQTAPKGDFTDFGRDIDEEMISYALQDVEVTRECYEMLVAEYGKHGLTSTLPTRIYSEASLGKAYLEAMNIRPWRRVQRDFPDKILGAIMGSYFGGRAEIHRRREVVRTIYCDFASMYPSVCTLQGLWRFVIATGVDWRDATAETQAFLRDCDLAALQHPKTWGQLPTLVRVKPDSDIFPVRARYGQDGIPTIGLNYLSADRGLWFTLADCIASKLLTGKPPEIDEAIRFTPRPIQRNLKSIDIAGNPKYAIRPARDDFYKRLIDLRRSVKSAAGAATSQGEKERLNSEQLALKILANATSYGIFVELNVEHSDKPETRQIHAGEGSFQSPSKHIENPGNFFHPLLGTLITGAARLMLAITERLAADRDVDWAFCDTDSMAFAMPPGMQNAESNALVFQQKVEDVCAWFELLNPYEAKGSILELEDQNFDPDDSSRQLPLYCFAVSAKWYALFNIDAAGNPVIRKASAHGLGHLLSALSRRRPGRAERDSGVLLWQEDLWRDIVAAAWRGELQPIPFAVGDQLALPAASRYSATTPAILGWFRKYNEERQLYAERIRPFGFLTWLHAKRPEEQFWEKSGEQGDAWDSRARSPKPVAPYDRDISKAADNARDRETWEPVPRSWLRTYAEALRLYHIHPETKFLGGGYTQSGSLRRRHVFASAVEYIGEEADSWEEDSHFGADEDSTIALGLPAEDRARMVEAIRRAVRVEKVGVKRLAKQAGLADRTVTRAVAHDPAVSDEEVARLFRAVEVLLARKQAEDLEVEELLEWARAQPRSRLATELGYDISNFRKVLSGKISPKRVLSDLQKLRRSEHGGFAN